MDSEFNFNIPNSIILRDNLSYINDKVFDNGTKQLKNYNVSLSTENFDEKDLKKIKKILKKKRKEINTSLVEIYNNNKLQNTLNDIYNLLPSSVKDKLKSLTKKSEYEYLFLLHYIREHSLPFLKEYSFGYGNKLKYYAENRKGDRLYFINSLGICSDQNVYKAYLVRKKDKIPTEEFLNSVKDTDENIRVVKWTIHENMENGIWDMYLERGLPDPGIDTSFRYLGYECTVLKLLKNIEYNDPNVYIDLGVQILAILKDFHDFGCHSDIKPDNILKSLTGNRYYLIDMGGVSTEKRGKGYFRACYSPRYTCQESDNRTRGGEIIFGLHDLVELGFSISIIYCKCNNIAIDKTTYRYIIVDSPVWKYMNEVEKLDKENIKKKDYDKLIKLLESFRV